jgi:hypothetical protein
LIDLCRIGKIDIFKLDIEGAEKELFSVNYERWLEKTNVIIIELHDRFRDGCTEELNNATNPFRFSRKERKDHVILFKTIKNFLGGELELQVKKLEILDTTLAKRIRKSSH